MHTIDVEFRASAAHYKVVVAGAGADGTPAGATVKPTRAWRGLIAHPTTAALARFANPCR